MEEAHLPLYLLLKSYNHHCLRSGMKSHIQIQVRQWLFRHGVHLVAKKIYNIYIIIYNQKCIPTFEKSLIFMAVFPIPTIWKITYPSENERIFRILQVLRRPLLEKAAFALLRLASWSPNATREMVKESQIDTVWYCWWFRNPAITTWDV